MNRDRILLINYYWPPCGGSAVQRWLSFVKHLSLLDVDTDVITIDLDKAAFPFMDETLLGQIPDTTRVYRTDSSDLFSFYINKVNKGKVPSYSDNKPGNISFLKKMAYFIRGNFLLPDPKKGWNKHVIAQAKELISKNDYKAIITAGPPQSTHLAGLALKKMYTHITWIADLHDYWTDIFSLKNFYRTKLANAIDRQFEKNVLSHADKVLIHCQSALEIYKKRYGAIMAKATVLTMGYDDTVIDSISKSSVRDDKFVIAYTGIITKEYQPDVYLTACHELIKEGLNIRLVFAGAIYPELKAKVAVLGMEDYFDFLGYISHEEVIKLLRQASLLLLVNPRNNHSDTVVPGKVYEYLAIGKPILSIAGENSENKKIVEGVGGGENYHWDDKDGIKSYVKQQYLQPSVTHNPLIHQLYARSNQAQVIKDMITG